MREVKAERERQRERETLYIVRDSAYFVYPLFIVGWLPFCSFVTYFLHQEPGVPTAFLPAPRVFLMRTYVCILYTAASCQPRVSFIEWSPYVRNFSFARKSSSSFQGSIVAVYACNENDMKFIARSDCLWRCEKPFPITFIPLYAINISEFHQVSLSEPIRAFRCA